MDSGPRREADHVHRTPIPLVASLVALSSGVVWSFGAVAARLADHTDAFQYLIWRSIGIIVVIEVVAAGPRSAPRHARPSAPAG